ncbi:lymphatic vessel endothelial hyaluronic acid receptor 1-like [Pristis pectinata]|uniref:lymphatic vessel endothelial hyaluronic acid receptor 1-like n=1 Tax=Pristis pectinata TaxID=685728 RepID=UPI00223C93D1|nr:lymphatic vessel endothelial hyaluronic acid receptor 1-like [Pristis pectinata]
MARWGVISVVVLSQVLVGLPQAPLNIQDIKYDECRVWGVFHIILEDEYNLNLSQAHKACQLFDSVLATKAQVDRALQQGFERCRYGWVEDGFLVIPRITLKEICGQNKTGVVIWKQDPAMKYDAYCFRQNDSKKANVCEPLIFPPTTFTTEASSVEPGQEITPAFSSETVPHPESGATTLPQETRSVLSTLIQTSVSTQDIDDKTDPKGNKPLLGNQIIYCVLVVIVILLLAFLVILICYLRKRRSFSYSSTRGQKENIEAEVWSHSLTANNS